MPVPFICLFVAVHVSVQEVLFGFQGAMPYFCRLLPRRIRGEFVLKPCAYRYCNTGTAND